MPSGGGRVTRPKSTTSPSTSQGPAYASATPATPEPERKPGSASRLGLHRFVLFPAWIALIIVFGALRPGTFLTVGSLQAVVNSQTPLVILALSILPTLLVNDYDLSVAANAGLVSTLIATLTLLHGWPIGPAIVVAVVTALAVGIINAILVVRLNLNSIVMTLGMATLLDGVADMVSGSQTLSGISKGLTSAFVTPVFGIQLSVVYGVIVAAVLAYLFQSTPLGRRLTFTGQARDAAVLAGINPSRLRFGAYIGGAVIAALSGVAGLASQGGIQPGLSETQLLPAFAAAFFSTVVFTVGRFNSWGTVAAIYFLTTGIVGLQVLGISGSATDVFYGGALVIAVAGSTVARRRLAASAAG